jgi:hypothetical protein
MHRTVIALTTLFILMTIPSTLGSIYYSQLIQTDMGTFLLFLADCIDNSYHALNIVILVVTNRKFRQEAKIVLYGTRPDTQISSTTNNNNTNNQH